MSALDLDLLSEYLDGDQNEYGLDFAATHGFLCAIAVGPTFAKWLDELFDNNQKKVPAEIIAQVKAWLESIRQNLANEEGIEFPFEIEEADVESSLGIGALVLSMQCSSMKMHGSRLSLKSNWSILLYQLWYLVGLMKKIRKWKLSVVTVS
jgi:hypothetical protein